MVFPVQLQLPAFTEFLTLSRISGSCMDWSGSVYRKLAELFAQVAGFAAEKNLPIFIHVGNYREVAALIDYSERCPTTKFIVGHLFGLELYLQSRRKLENLFFEISNTYLVSTLSVNKAIDCFGAHRIILGPDTPYGRNSLQRNIDRVKTLPISEEAKEMILGKNIQMLLRLN